MTSKDKPVRGGVVDKKTLERGGVAGKDTPGARQSVERGSDSVDVGDDSSAAAGSFSSDAGAGGEGAVDTGDVGAGTGSGDVGVSVVDGVPDVPADFVNQCLDANELGDGMLYAYLHQGQYIFVAQHDEWYFWAGHYWQRDLTDKAAGAVETVALAYLQEVHALGVKIKEAEKADEKDRAKKLKDRRL